MNTRIFFAAILFAVAAAGTACAQSPDPVLIQAPSTQARVLTPIPPAQDGRPSSEMESRLLEAHNIERLRMGASSLIWSEGLEAEAREWAVTLIDSRRFEHDTRRHGHGENLWMGWGPHDFSPEEMVGGWIEERRDYRPGVFPNVSRTGNWVAVGHYTQLIWRGTTHVGCAVVTRGDRSILACRYSPPGNIDGRRP